MKQRIRTAAMAILLASGLTGGWAQPSPAQLQQQQFQQQQQLYGQIEADKRRTQTDEGAISRESQQRAQAEWQAREDAIQAKIAKWRATPYYGTLITQGTSLQTVWGGGAILHPRLPTRRLMQAVRKKGAVYWRGCLMAA